MERTSGRPEVTIALIDGPVATQHPDLESEHLREIPGSKSTACVRDSSTACLHGTFIAGILSAKRNSPGPAVCPNCTLLVRPIFAEATAGREGMPSATPTELAAAIIECIDAGARVINLSLALEQPSAKGEQSLEEALNQALKRGVIVVAAAGNQGTVGSSVITRHPWVIPVVACDIRGRPMNESNLGGSIGRRGLRAPGDSITSLGAEGQALTLGGTSVAVPFVTGATALLWSAFPSATAAHIKLAVTQTSRPRRASLVPPLLDAAAAYQVLLHFHGLQPFMAHYQRKNNMQEHDETPEHSAAPPVQANDAPVIVSSRQVHSGTTIAPQGAGTTCSCGGAPDVNTNDTAVASYVYAIGRVEARFPNLAAEREFAQATGRTETAGKTDQQTLHAVLSKRENRYLARQLCWVLTIQGLETYLLTPRDPADLDLLVEAIRPAPSPNDIDVVIGLRGPIAPPAMCNGLMVPIVAFDQIYSFDRNTLIKAIPKPEKITAAQFAPAAEELFDRIMQVTDNAGATDEHRALNYMAMRYPAIYAKAAEAFAQSRSLTGVEVRPSPLSSSRTIVDIIFAYTDRNTDFTEKFFVRCDVTEEFPFLVTKMSPYYDR